MTVEYLDLADYVAIACEPDGNKRAAWVSLRVFLEINGWSWAVRPSVDEAESGVLATAAGEWDEGRMAAWLREKLVREPAPRDSG